MDLKFVLAFSVLLQFTATFLALRLIRLTGKRKAWLLISAAISLMALRRSITLGHMLSEGLSHPPDPAAEWVALATSALLLAGIALIGPLFLSIKRSEDAQRKINRALRMLSSVNQVIIRSTEESALLKDACRTILEVGGYRMAWVGLAEQDEEKTVRPVAQAGYEEGYLDSLDITWADTERGRCPTGKAIRTGKPCMAKNILTDPDYAPWRDEATRRGYTSSVSIPLIAKNQTLGALSMYAEKPDAFDTEEVNLLNELTDDLAYGIMALRAHIERMLAEETLSESEERFRSLVETTSDWIWEVDENGVYTYASPKVRDILGYESEKVVGKTPFDLMPADEAEHIVGLFMDISRARKPFEQLENVNQHKDGRLVVLETSGVPIIDTSGKFRGYRGVDRDITERKLAEQALRKSEEDLQERVKELEEFYKMAIGRELRMIELKEEIERLKESSEKEATQ